MFFMNLLIGGNGSHIILQVLTDHYQPKLAGITLKKEKTND